MNDKIVDILMSYIDIKQILINFMESDSIQKYKDILQQRNNTTTTNTLDTIIYSIINR